MKYFVVSDIHSYYENFIAALQKNGFDESNPSHMLVVLGDLFDRGPGTLSVLEYMKRLKAAQKVVLVKGNHESLLEDCIVDGKLTNADRQNGTERTLLDLSGLNSKYEFESMGGPSRAAQRLEGFIGEMVYYFETPHYLFVHSWMPPDYRHASVYEWERAMWVDPWTKAMKGLASTDKTVVFGHWHISHGRILAGELSAADEFDFEKVENFRTFEWKEKNVIGIDGCTAATGLVNVVVLED